VDWGTACLREPVLRFFETALCLCRQVATEGFFFGLLRQNSDGSRKWDPVSVALAFMVEESWTRASPGMELKLSLQASVPTLDPGPTWADRSGTGGFDSPHLPVSGAVVFGTS